MAKYIEYDDKNFPEKLRNIKKVPKRLYYNGDIKLLNSKCFSIIGSRDLTDYGKRIEKRFVKNLALRGITIVSRNGYWC